MSGGASQPAAGAALQSLQALNKSSGRVATFASRPWGGRQQSYTFRRRNDATDITGHKFEVYLVGSDSQHYCIGFVKGSEADCKKAMEKYTKKLCHRIVKGRL